MEIQDLLHRKVFGDYSAGTHPPAHRWDEWVKLCHGRDRAVRTIARSLLGTPSGHVGDHGHVLWCFQFASGHRLVVCLNRGTTVEIAVSEESDDVVQALDFLVSEMTRRVSLL